MLCVDVFSNCNSLPLDILVPVTSVQAAEGEESCWCTNPVAPHGHRCTCSSKFAASSDHARSLMLCRKARGADEPIGSFSAMSIVQEREEQHLQAGLQEYLQNRK
jgi:hypothetical protein